MTAGVIGHWANRVGYVGKVEYVIEDGDDGVEMQAALKRLYASAEQRAHTRMAAHPRLAPKGNVRGLEASDFVAWHWNKYYEESVKTDARRPRKDLVAFLDHTPKNKVLVYLYTGRDLEQFLLDNGCSRVPPPVEAE